MQASEKLAENLGAVKLESVSKSYGNKVLFKDLNFSFRENSIHCFLGPSGCGKTTLLKIIMGLEPPSEGRVVADRQSAGVVFQSAQLLGWRSVAENIFLPLDIKGLPRCSLKPLLSTLKLDNTEALFPHQLSGGMQMRVSLARALITQPSVLFLDEPLSALDESTRHQLQQEIRNLKAQQKLTAFLVTHSFSEAAYMADYIYIFKSGGEVHAFPSPLPRERNPDLRYSSGFQSWVSELERELKDVP